MSAREVGRSLRRHLIAGLVVIAPVSITAVVLWWIFERLDGLLGDIIYPAIGIAIPGLGLLLLLALLVAVGWAAERAVGARVVASWHAVLERFPLTRRLYTASNRIVRTVFGEDKRFFRDVVLVEYPGPGRWSIGFITTRAPAAAAARVEDGVTVFIPTTPNPTTGYLVVVARREVIPLSWTLEEAFTYILSAGGVAPVGGEAPAAPGRIER
ncbi:MAG TPA: DUF502 domain-containing protein [Longimicrobiales bacterium]